MLGYGRRTGLTAWVPCHVIPPGLSQNMMTASLSRVGTPGPTRAAPCRQRASARVAASAAVEAFVPSDHLVRPSTEGPIVMDGTVLHSCTHQQLDVIESMQSFFGDNILPLLTPVDQLWQPTDFLPESNSENFIEEVGADGGCQNGTRSWLCARL